MGLVRKLLRGLTPPRREAVVVETPAEIDPFSGRRAWSPAEADAYRRRLGELGIRLHPYPFASSVAIASDIDNSERGDFEGYVDLLVHRLGLDFGDSFRLFRRQEKLEALALFRCDGAPPPWSERGRPAGDSLGFVEVVRQIHLGNVDHLHGLDGHGGRVLWLRDVVHEDGTGWIARVPDEIERVNTRPFNFRSDLVPVVRVAIRSRTPLPEGVTVRLRRVDGAEGPPVLTLDRVAPGEQEDAALGEPGGAIAWFRLDREPGWPDPPLVPELARVEIEAPRAVEIEAVVLVNFSRAMVREALETLADRLGVRVNLLTDHASKLFVNRGSETRHGGRSAERAFATPLPALYGRARGTALAYSALGDDPESICYVLPELRAIAGLRFINPGGKSGEPEAGFDLLETVVPTTVRDGSTIYLARRCRVDIPRNADVPRSVRNDMGTRSFPHRISALLEELRAGPGRAWPLYTHLGNLAPKRDRTSPYFPPAPFHRLQDHVFGITGGVAPAQRAWFTRASVLYDYALMTRSIAPHVVRDGPDVVRIASWHDETLGRRLPGSPHQLHGLTFYVDDAGAAAVFLDEEPLEEITRNAADETGRPSVTIVGAGIRHPIGRGLGPVTLAAADEPRVVPPGDADPAGCQLLAWSERRSSPSARVGLLLDTTTGGRFHFGDAELAPADCDATYALPPAPAGAWRRCVAPFYAMTWRPGAAPGGPLPAHPPARLTLTVRGERGDRAEIDRIEMLRPSTTAPPATHCVVGGRVQGAAPRTTVTLAYDDHGARVVRDDPILGDGGFFLFTGVPVGVTAEVARAGPGEPPAAEPGVRFTVRGHDVGLVLA